jgi:hypothetical protein
MSGCPHKCSNGHVLRDGKWYRCECLERTLYKKDLGLFSTETPLLDTQLKGYVGNNLVIEGSQSNIREHVAGAILWMRGNDKTFAATDAYTLVDIFLDKDTEFENSAALVEYDLYTMLLGFGEVKNQRLPDLIEQVLVRRKLHQKPTWVVLGIPLGQVPTRFASEIAEILKLYQRVQIK